MTNIGELEQQEIEELTIDNEEVLELEELIIQGSKATIPIIIDYPVYNGEKVEYQPVSAFIKPLTNNKVTEAYRKGMKNKTTTPNIEIVKMGLYNKNMELFKPELIEKMAGGIVNSISKQIMEVSGIQINQEDATELVRRLMDF